MTGQLAIVFITVFVIGISTRGGLHAATGRTGLVHTRAQDRRGAWQGAAVGGALLGVVATLAAGAVARHLVTIQQLGDTALALSAVYGPYALALGLAVSMTRSRNWKVRSWANALGVGALDFLWPAMAVLGIALALFMGSGALAMTLGVAAVGITMVTRRLVEAVWHRRDVHDRR